MGTIRTCPIGLTRRCSGVELGPFFLSIQIFLFRGPSFRFPGIGLGNVIKGFIEINFAKGDVFYFKIYPYIEVRIFV